SAKGSSGLLGLVISPDGAELGAITGRSIHRFALPELQPLGSEAHGAEDPTSAAWWDFRGVVVGGADGRLHRPGAKPGLEPIVCVGGYGEHRVAVHGAHVAVWQGNRQKRPFHTGQRFVEVRVDRDGRLITALPERGGGQVYDPRTGRRRFDAGPDTADTPKMEVGGSIVAAMLSQGGLRWYELKANQVFELPWPRTFSLSGSGTWLAVTTPAGRVKVLDPTTGEDAIPQPEPLSERPVTLVSFVNRRPDMLVMDGQGVLGVYDLTDSVTHGTPAKGRAL